MATEKDSVNNTAAKIKEFGPEERAVAKTAIEGISPYEVAAALGRSKSYITNQRSSLVENELLQSEGERRWTTYTTDREEIEGNLNFEELLHKDFEIVSGTLLEDASNQQISEKIGLHASTISNRKGNLIDKGVLSSEGQYRWKEYYPGIRLVDRLNRMDKINYGHATPFIWNPDESRVFWDSEDNNAETLDELDMLDRLAFRIDQEINSDYDMPELNELNPIQRWQIDSELVEQKVSEGAVDEYPEEFQQEPKDNREELYRAEKGLGSVLGDGWNVINEYFGPLIKSIRERDEGEAREGEIEEIESSALIPPSFEYSNGSILIDPDNEDLRQAIEERYEEDELDIDMFDISDSDIEEFVNAFDIEYQPEKDDSKDEEVEESREEKKQKRKKMWRNYSGSGRKRDQGSDWSSGEESMPQNRTKNKRSKGKLEDIREKRKERTDDRPRAVESNRNSTEVSDINFERVKNMFLGMDLEDVSLEEMNDFLYERLNDRLDERSNDSSKYKVVELTISGEGEIWGKHLGEGLPYVVQYNGGLGEITEEQVQDSYAIVQINGSTNKAAGLTRDEAELEELII